jgi:DNA modification methylase
MEWPRRIIKGWCPPGGTVLDPFAGTGTVGVVARTLGRKTILNDLSEDYCRLARWRVSDPKQIERAKR